MYLNITVIYVYNWCLDYLKLYLKGVKYTQNHKNAYINTGVGINIKLMNKISYNFKH